MLCLGTRTSFRSVGSTVMSVAQAFFMPFFFFICAKYMVRSVDRHGPRAAFAKRAKRYGAPFVVYTFAVGPANDYLLSTFLGRTFEYRIDPGPTWFLAWALLFCGGVASVRRPRRAQRPPLWAIVLACAAVGAAQGALTFFLRVPTFAMMPVPAIGSLLHDALFFFAGCCSEEWTFEDAYRPSIALSAAAVAAVSLAPSLSSAPFAPLASNLTYAAGSTECMLSSDFESGTTAVASSTPLEMSVAVGFVYGALAPLLSIALLGCVVKCGGGGSRGDSAYVVYLIHVFVVEALVLAYARLLLGVELDGALFFVDGDRADVSAWGGYLGVALLAQGISWSVASTF